jgi:hypothetical protein
VGYPRGEGAREEPFALSVDEGLQALLEVVSFARESAEGVRMVGV